MLAKGVSSTSCMLLFWVTEDDVVVIVFLSLLRLFVEAVWCNTCF